MESHPSESELSRKLAEAAELVTVGADYLHYKNKPYKVLQLAFLEETMEVGVVYQAQYGENLSFIRPLSNWLEDVEYEGRTLKRFTKQ